MRSREEVRSIREEYPIGTHVKLIFMDDRFAPPSGTKGIVYLVDDDGQIHVNWDNGSTLAVIPGVDNIETLEESR